MFAYEDPVVLSKALIKFADDNDKLAIKGGVFEGRFMDPAGVKVLSQMPSKPELQAKLLAMINAPATQLVRLIQEPGARMVRLLESFESQRLNNGISAQFNIKGEDFMEGVSREQVKDFIKNMTLMDAAALVKELEEELGVSAAAPVAVRRGGRAGGGGR